MTRGVGSPYYMAPEMLRGDDKYTRAVDVYSFAIVCVELWNEELPYSEVEFEAQFTFAVYVMEGHRPQIRKDCPEDLVKLITTCWSSDRLGRPPFSQVTKEMTSVFENVSQSTPKDIEHVKPRETKKDKNSSRTRSKTKRVKTMTNSSTTFV